MTGPDPRLRRAGRPPVLSEAERVGAILDAARRTFAEAGYAATTMDRIAATAQMSKRSLYRHFSDKVEVFHALLEECQPDDMVARLEETAADCGAHDARASLKAWLLDLAAFVMRPAQVNLFRLAIAESSANSEVSQAFYGETMARSIAVLAKGLALMQAKGRLGPGDPQRLAEILMGAAFGPTALREIMCAGAITAPPLAEIGARIDLAMDLMGPRLFPPER